MKTVLVLSALLYAALAGLTHKNGAPDGSENEKMPAEDEDEGFCPDGWLTYGFRCYIFVNTPMNWSIAKDHCNSLGANLASVSNQREYRFLQQMTKTAGQSYAWLGGFYLQGSWLWINNEGFNYTLWFRQFSPTTYPCLYILTNLFSDGWSNAHCSSAGPFICSK
uniref:C-type lectin domain-containing protein n=1 Tax=Tetraodon nigroviridis TaxID=99883 RepID=H3C1V6_TETNG